MNTTVFPRDKFREIAARERHHIYCWQSDWDGELVWVFSVLPPPFGIRCILVQPPAPRGRVPVGAAA